MVSYVVDHAGFKWEIDEDKIIYVNKKDWEKAQNTFKTYIPKKEINKIKLKIYGKKM